MSLSLSLCLLQPQNVCPIRSVLPAAAAGHIDPSPGELELSYELVLLVCTFKKSIDLNAPRTPLRLQSTNICWSILLVAWIVLFAKYRKYFNYRVGFKLKLCSRLAKRGEPE